MSRHAQKETNTHAQEPKTGMRQGKSGPHVTPPPGRDEIEVLRAGGAIRETRQDMENVGPGSYRTYGHSFDKDVDDDFDSSYGDDEKLFDDTAAENRFLQGTAEDEDYGSSSGYGVGTRDKKIDERQPNSEIDKANIDKPQAKNK